ncbi:hypothetical protein T484DRAFT_1753442 [Baffinella frigidus]|nr:hypothetical protein T484DRAFT_1753442 [Cryptophyta sp. CCMP2293]
MPATRQNPTTCNSPAAYPTTNPFSGNHPFTGDRPTRNRSTASSPTASNPKRNRSTASSPTASTPKRNRSTASTPAASTPTASAPAASTPKRNRSTASTPAASNHSSSKKRRFSDDVSRDSNSTSTSPSSNHEKRRPTIVAEVMRSHHTPSSDDIVSIYGVCKGVALSIILETTRLRAAVEQAEQAVKEGVHRFSVISKINDPTQVKSSLKWFHQQFVSHPCQFLVKKAVGNAILDIDENMALPGKDAAEARWRRATKMVAEYNEYMPFKASMNTVVAIVYSANAVRSILQQQFSDDRVHFDTMSEVMVFQIGEAFVMIATSGPKVKSDKTSNVKQNVKAGKRPLQWYLDWGDHTSAFVFVNIPSDSLTQTSGSHGWSKYTPTCTGEVSSASEDSVPSLAVDTRPPSGVNDLSMAGLHFLDAAMFAVRDVEGFPIYNSGNVDRLTGMPPQSHVYFVPEYGTTVCAETNTTMYKMKMSDELQTFIRSHTPSKAGGVAEGVPKDVPKDAQDTGGTPYVPRKNYGKVVDLVPSDDEEDGGDDDDDDGDDDGRVESTDTAACEPEDVCMKETPCMIYENVVEVVPSDDAGDGGDDAGDGGDDAGDGGDDAGDGGDDAGDGGDDGGRKVVEVVPSDDAGDGGDDGGRVESTDATGCELGDTHSREVKERELGDARIEDDQEIEGMGLDDLLSSKRFGSVFDADLGGGVFEPIGFEDSLPVETATEYVEDHPDDLDFLDCLILHTDDQPTDNKPTDNQSAYVTTPPPVKNPRWHEMMVTHGYAMDA